MEDTDRYTGEAEVSHGLEQSVRHVSVAVVVQGEVEVGVLEGERDGPHRVVRLVHEAAVWRGQ